MGQSYLFPLFYGRDGGGSYFVIASKGGAPEHPGWYRNILANPLVDIQVGTEKLQARARTATGEERARLWKQAVEFSRLTPNTRSRRPAGRFPWSCSIQLSSLVGGFPLPVMARLVRASSCGSCGYRWPGQAEP